MSEPDVRNVLEADDVVTAPGDDQLLEVLWIVEPADGPQQVASLAAFDLAARGIAVARRHRAAHIREGDLSFGQRRRIEQNLNLLFRAAAEPHIGHVRDALQPRPDIVVDEVAHHVHVELARITRQRRDTEIHEGVGAEGACAHARLVHVLRIRGDLAQRVVDADERLVEVDIVGELHLDACCAAGGARDDAFKAWDRAEIFLLLDNDLFLDVLRCRAGPARVHRDRAHLEIWNHLHGDTEGSNDTEHAHDQGDDRHQGSALDDLLEHCALRLLPQLASLTVWPSRKDSLPRTTTRSPSFRPLRT